MRNFWRDMFYAVATGALIGTIIRQRRERLAALARQAQAVPPVITPARPPRRWPRRQRARPSGLRWRSRWPRR